MKYLPILCLVLIFNVNRLKAQVCDTVDATEVDCEERIERECDAEMSLPVYSYKVSRINGTHNIKSDTAFYNRYKYHWILFYDFYTTLTGIHYVNTSGPAESDHIYFYYNLDLKNNLEFRRIKWDLYVFNDYGIRHFFDSITCKTDDQFTLKNSLYYPLFRDQLFISVAASTQTKLWKTHQYRIDDQGEREKYLYDAYMSPGVVLYSGGITWETKGNTIVQIGLGSSKITRIRNQKIFETREEENIYGLKKGQSKKTEFGLTATATVPMQTIHKVIRWEFFGNVFAPVSTLDTFKTYNVDINNVWHLILFRYVRISWRTKINYNQDLFDKVRIQNQLSLGFYLSNRL